MNTPDIDTNIKMPRCYGIDEVKRATTLGRTAIYDFIAKGELKTWAPPKTPGQSACDLIHSG